MKTLEQILDYEKAHRTEGGAFGITECKDSINFMKEFGGKSYFSQMEEFLERANNDPFFNDAMILACWELINQGSQEA